MESTPPGSEGLIWNIEGEKVALGPHRRELLPLYLKWVNDFAVTRTLSIGLGPMTWEAEVDWYNSSSGSNPQNAVFTIYERVSQRPIGNTGLHKIDFQNRTAEFGIMIGEKDCWGKGYGTETTRLMLDYGFNCLGLHNIMLRVYSFNQRGVRAYTRAGFKPAGRIREACRLGDQAYDEILMDCLASEFQSPVLRKLLSPD